MYSKEDIIGRLFKEGHISLHEVLILATPTVTTQVIYLAPPVVNPQPYYEEPRWLRYLGNPAMEGFPSFCNNQIKTDNHV